MEDETGRKKLIYETKYEREKRQRKRERKGYMIIIYSPSFNVVYIYIDMLHNYKWQGRVLEVREDRGFVELSSNIQHNSHPQAAIHFLPQLENQLQQQFAHQQQRHPNPNHNHNHRKIADNIRMNNHNHHHHPTNNNNNNDEVR